MRVKMQVSSTGSVDPFHFACRFAPQLGYHRGMQPPEVARERETRPAKWVIDLMDRRGLMVEDVAVLVRKSSSTIWRWRRTGVEYLDWIGLLCLLDLDHEWKPGDPVSPRKKKQ